MYVYVFWSLVDDAVAVVAVVVVVVVVAFNRVPSGKMMERNGTKMDLNH